MPVCSNTRNIAHQTPPYTGGLLARPYGCTLGIPLTPLTLEHFDMPRPLPTADCYQIQNGPNKRMLQQRLPGMDWRSLRALRIDGQTHYLLGHSQAWRLYPAATIVPFILRHTYLPEHPLPEAGPAPAALDRLAEMSGDALRFLVLYATGGKPSEILTALGIPLAQGAAISAMLAEVEIGIIPHEHMVNELTDYERQVAQARADERDAEPDTSGTILTPPARRAGMQYGIPEPIPTEEWRRLAVQSDGKPGRGNTRWPFSAMKQGEMVRIPADVAARAQRAVHMYATRHRNKKFRTERDRFTGDLKVYRIDTPTEGIPFVIDRG